MTSQPSSDPLGAFAPQELHRYARHLSLEEVGPEGQLRLKRARVLVVGAGGLGSPAALYLAAAGVGTLGIIDADRVELSNLQRQVLHATGAVGRMKVESARERLVDTNPHVELVTHPVRLSADNAMEIVGGYDVVVDGSDNFPTRYLVNDACILLGKPWVYGAILRWEGQVSLFGAPGGPCYRCLFREPPPPGLVPGCAEAGVIGALPGAVGSLQALEAVKWILGLGREEDGAPGAEDEAAGPGGRGAGGGSSTPDSPNPDDLTPGRSTGARSAAGRLLIMDTLRFAFRTVEPRRDPECPICGDSPTIHSLVDYEWFCATGQTRPPEPVGMEAARDGRAPSGSEAPEPQPGSGPDAGEPPIQVLTPAELREALAGPRPPLLVDVRERWEWAVSSLEEEGAIHLPLKELEARLRELPRDRDLVLYCRSGARSHRGAGLLMKAGFPRVRNLAGGLERWAGELAPEFPVA
jgi:sulfur-carrier protein adenylyltransferase/sulfurtransferase